MVEIYFGLILFYITAKAMSSIKSGFQNIQSMTFSLLWPNATSTCNGFMLLLFYLNNNSSVWLGKMHTVSTFVYKEYLWNLHMLLECSDFERDKVLRWTIIVTGKKVVILGLFPKVWVKINNEHSSNSGNKFLMGSNFSCWDNRLGYCSWLWNYASKQSKSGNDLTRNI